MDDRIFDNPTRFDGSLFPHLSNLRTDGPSFAFVEYEDRRDAADAYDRMHKKLIGRDTINVEVDTFPQLQTSF